MMPEDPVQKICVCLGGVFGVILTLIVLSQLPGYPLWWNLCALALGAATGFLMVRFGHIWRR